MAELGRICADLGPELLDVVLAPRGLDVVVREVAVHDPLDPPGAGIAAGDLVLGVGIAGNDEATRQLIEAAGGVGALALVLRRRAEPPASIVTVAEDAGVALLQATADAPWGGLHELLRTSLATNPSSELPSIPGTAMGDLLALADATAAAAGGPITIEDMQGRVLAFSDQGQELDPERAETVLSRRIPDRRLRELRRLGVFDRLMGSEDIVAVDFPGAAPRRVIAIRAGAAVLGAIWLVTTGGPHPERADEALRDAARIAAVHVVRHRVRDDLERRVRRSMVRMLLRGEGRVAPMLARLGLPAESDMVVAVLEPADEAGGAPQLDRLLDLAVAHLRAYRWAVAATAMDGRVYLIVVLRQDGAERGLRQTLQDCVVRARHALKVDVRAGMGQPASPGEAPADARRGADRALELGAANTVVTLEEVQGRAILAEVLDFLRDQRMALSPELRALLKHDRDHGTEYVATLQALLAVESDPGQAARRVGIHVNTLRYRVRRIVEITGADLANADVRLALEMQLRTLSGGAASKAA
jgi:DNA-binding PucR family transcriptional regulator